MSAETEQSTDEHAESGVPSYDPREAHAILDTMFEREYAAAADNPDQEAVLQDRIDTYFTPIVADDETAVQTQRLLDEEFDATMRRYERHGGEDGFERPEDAEGVYHDVHGYDLVNELMDAKTHEAAETYLQQLEHFSRERAVPNQTRKMAETNFPTPDGPVMVDKDTYAEMIVANNLRKALYLRDQYQHGDAELIDGEQYNRTVRLPREDTATEQQE